MKHKNKITATLLVLSIVFIATFIFIPYVSNSIAFVPGLDIRSQYRPFFEEFRRLLNGLLKSRLLPFWSWNVFFGNNFWAAKSYYIIGDLYSYLSILINRHFYETLMYVSLLKYLVAGLGFYFYGSFRGWKPLTRFVGALLFTYSSWSLKFIESPIFLSFFSFIPFYFLSLELAMHKRKYFFFSLMSGLMLITNFYLFYTLSIFTLIYFTYRFYEREQSFRGYFRSAWALIFLYLIGVLLSGLIVLPGIIFILDNSRILSNNQSLLYFENIRVYFHMMISHFVPSATFVSRIDSVNGVEQYISIHESVTYQTRDLHVWSGTLTALLLIQSLFEKNYRRYLNRTYIVLMLLLLIFPIGGAFLHGLSEHSFRWTIFYIFINIMISMRYIDNIELINVKVLKISTWIITLLAIVNIPVLAYITGEDIFRFNFQLGIFLFAVLMFYLTKFFLIQKSNQSKYFLIALLIIELSLTAYLTFNNPIYKKLDWSSVYSSESVLEKEPGQLKKFLQYLDKDYGFYRIYAPFETVYWQSSLNMNLLYDFSDIKTYDSTYQYALDDLSRLFDINRGFGWLWNIEIPELINFGSVKYAIVTNASELPHENFQFIDDYLGLKLYRNNHYRPIANTYTKVISYEDFQNEEFDFSIKDFIVAENHQLALIERYLVSSEVNSIENVEVYQNMLLGVIYSNAPSFVVTSIAYDRGWQVFVNDSLVSTYKVNGGFLSFPIENEVNNVKLYFMPLGFREGFFMSLIGGILLLCLIAFEMFSVKKYDA